MKKVSEKIVSYLLVLSLVLSGSSFQGLSLKASAKEAQETDVDFVDEAEVLADLADGEEGPAEDLADAAESPAEDLADAAESPVEDLADDKIEETPEVLNTKPIESADEASLLDVSDGYVRIMQQLPDGTQKEVKDGDTVYMDVSEVSDFILHGYDSNGNIIQNTGLVEYSAISPNTSTGTLPSFINTDAENEGSYVASYSDGSGLLHLVMSSSAPGSAAAKTGKIRIIYGTSVSREFTIVVCVPAKELKISGTDGAPANHSYSFSVTQNPGNADDIPVWSVLEKQSNGSYKTASTDVAKISQDGILTTYAPANLRIHVDLVSKGLENPRSVSADKDVLIYKHYPATTFNFTESSYFIEPGGVLDLRQMLTVKSADGHDSTDVLTWATSNKNIADVNENGFVTASARGTVTITVYAEDKTIYQSCQVTVMTPATSIVFDSPSYTLRLGQSRTVTAIENPTSANDRLVWSVSPENIVSVEPDEVDEDGLTNKQTAVIKALKEGTCVLTATSRANNTVKYTAQINVNPKLKANGIEIIMDGNNVDAGTAKVYQNRTITFSANLTSEGTTENPDGDIEWDVKNNDGDLVVTNVDKKNNNYLITGNLKGTVTVYAYAKDNHEIFSYCDVDVLEAATNVSLSQSNFSMYYKESNGYQLTATMGTAQENIPADETISWSSTNAAAATVDKDGWVKPQSAGTTKIVATTTNGLTASCNVEVIVPSEISLSEHTKEIQFNSNSESLSASIKTQGKTANNTLIHWKSSNPEVISVEEMAYNCQLIPKSIGKTTITATIGSQSDSCEVIVYTNMDSVTIEEIPDQIYLPDGELIKPTPRVEFNNKELISNIENADSHDYEIVYPYTSNVANVGTYTIKFVGDGVYYRGSKDRQFKIVQKDISESDIADPIKFSNHIYDGNPWNPDTSIYYGDMKLVKDKDYRLSYKNNTNAGTAEVTISGDGNFKGTVECTFKIDPLDANELIFQDFPEQTYNGVELTPVVSVQKKDRDDRVSQVSNTSNETCYQLRYDSNINAGTGHAIYTFQGNYTGTVTKDFTILPKQINNGVNVAMDGSFLYTGNEIRPEKRLDFKTNNKEIVLEEGKDFDCSYTDNINVGNNAKVTITGKGNYTNSIERTYSIRQRDLSDEAIEVKDLHSEYYFTSSRVIPELSIVNTLMPKGTGTLLEGRDYTITYENNVNLTTAASPATYKIQGIGNYTGTYTGSFSIVQKQGIVAANSLKITDKSGKVVQDTVYVDTGETSEYSVEITEASSTDIIRLDSKGTSASEVSMDFPAGGDGKKATLKVSGRGVGTDTVILTTQGGKYTKTLKIVVYCPATGIAIRENNTDITSIGTTLIASHTTQLSAALSPSNSTDVIKWSVSDTKIATISDEGVLRGVSPGPVLVTATVMPTENSQRGLSISTLVTINKNKPIESLILNKTSLKLNINDSETLTNTRIPEDATEYYTWSSSDTNIATVDETGKVQAVAKGTATISVKGEDDRVLAKCKVTVESPTSTIELDRQQYTVRKGTTFVLKATESPDTSSEALTWTSSNSNVVKVVSMSNPIESNIKTAKFTALKKGTVTLTATTQRENGNQVIATCTVTVVLKAATPAQVKISKAKNSSAGKVALSWKKTANAKGYQIWIATNKKFTKGKKKYTVKGKVKYTVSKLKKKTTYFFKVRAYNQDKAGIVYGSWSKVKKVKIKK